MSNTSVFYSKQDLLSRSHPRFFGGVRVSHPFSLVCSPTCIMCLSPVTSRRVQVLVYLFVFVCVQWCPAHIVFLRLVYRMLPVSLDCSFLIGPSVFSHVYSIE